MRILVTQNSHKWDSCNEEQMQTDRKCSKIAVPAATGTNFSPKYWDFVGLGLHLLFVVQNEYHSSSYILLG